MINSLATYCRVNKFGYIESPYKKVINGKVTSEIKYLSAIEEEKFTIAQANSALSKDGSFVEELVACRKNLNFELSSRENIDFIGGIKGTKELERLVDNNCAEIAFSLYPTSMDQHSVR